MKNRERFQASSWASGILIILIGSMGVVSCSASPNESSDITTTQVPSTVPRSSASPDSKGQNEVSQDLKANPQLTSSATAQSRQPPQLIKTANLTLRVEDLDKAIDQVGILLNKQQGDLLQLEQQQDSRNADRNVYILQLRIPQSNLNSTLSALENLGSVTRRTIHAQDVSDQLVDHQARLKNLRKSEEVVLKIMDRSGSIPDVLSASQELSSIREKIERLAAQQQSLKTRVAFSTVNLRVESTTPSRVSDNSLGKQLHNAWQQSTQSMGNLTMALLKLGIWGFAFSPYIVGIGLLIWVGNRYKDKTKIEIQPQKPES